MGELVISIIECNHGCIGKTLIMHTAGVILRILLRPGEYYIRVPFLGGGGGALVISIN